MSAAHTRILIADGPGPWRDGLANAISEVERAVRITEYGQEVRRALEEVTDPPKIIVLGTHLIGIGGCEALYQADRTLILEKKVRPAWPLRTVAMVTEARSDAELLDLFRRRGATQFIYRDDPLERTVNAILANLKPAFRSIVRIAALAEVHGRIIEGAVYDISRSGAQLVLGHGLLDEPIPVGTTIGLQLAFSTRRLECKAEVRRVSIRSTSHGGRLVLGLLFASMDDNDGYTLERIISEAAEEFELAREH